MEMCHSKTFKPGTISHTEDTLRATRVLLPPNYSESILLIDNDMADAEESPAQRQARIRREKREAKIKGTAQERLEKITKLSGRTPEMSEYCYLSTSIQFDV